MSPNRPGTSEFAPVDASAGLNRPDARRGWLWWLVDAVLVVVFAAAGRASHAESNAVLGVLGTAWPFLVGMSVGWLLVLAVSRRVPLSLRDGVWVWASTLVVGMVVRKLAGGGVAPSFIAVAGAVTALFLLGWRLLLARRNR